MYILSFFFLLKKGNFLGFVVFETTLVFYLYTVHTYCYNNNVTYNIVYTLFDKMLQRHKSYYILYGTILLYCYSLLNLRIFSLTASKLFTYKHVPNVYLSTRYENYIFITCPVKEKNSPESHIIIINIITIIIIIFIIVVIDPIIYKNSVPPSVLLRGSVSNI